MISIVIPVYGAPDTLKELYSSLVIVLEKEKQEFEIILINDACPQGSWLKTVELCELDKRVKGINLVRNFGQHNAMSCGLNMAKGDYIVVMDCDLQDDPVHITSFLKKAQEGYEVIIARRKIKKVSIIKRLQSWIFYKLLKIFLDVKMSHEVGNYGMYSRRVICEINKIQDRIRFFPYLVSWTGFERAFIDVTQNFRQEGESSYSFIKSLKLAFEFSIMSSSRPLIWSVFLGILCSLISFLIGAIFIGRYFLYGMAPSGWTSLSVSILFSTGLILFNIGVLGVYLGKVFEQGKQRPLYIVKEYIN